MTSLVSAAHQVMLSDTVALQVVAIAEKRKCTPAQVRRMLGLSAVV